MKFERAQADLIDDVGVTVSTPLIDGHRRIPGWYHDMTGHVDSRVELVP